MNKVEIQYDWGTYFHFYVAFMSFTDKNLICRILENLKGIPNTLEVTTIRKLFRIKNSCKNHK